MMNGTQYVESLKKLKPRIFYRGKRLDEPVRPSRACVPTSGPRRRRTTWRRVDNTTRS